MAHECIIGKGKRATGWGDSRVGWKTRNVSSCGTPAGNFAKNSSDHPPVTMRLPRGDTERWGACKASPARVVRGKAAATWAREHFLPSIRGRDEYLGLHRL